MIVNRSKGIAMHSRQPYVFQTSLERKVYSLIDNKSLKEGAIFNPLKVVSANERTSTKDSFAEVASLFFDKKEVIFKTDFDDYFGVYCSNEFQRLIEANELTGLGLRKARASHGVEIVTRM
jgi:sulfite reductase alpha subunit-like flavoprotein